MLHWHDTIPIIVDAGVMLIQHLFLRGVTLAKANVETSEDGKILTAPHEKSWCLQLLEERQDTAQVLSCVKIPTARTVSLKAI